MRTWKSIFMMFLAIMSLSSCRSRTSKSESSDDMDSYVREQYDVLTKTYKYGERQRTSHTIDLETIEGTYRVSLDIILKDNAYVCDYVTITDLVTDEIVTVSNIRGVISAFLDIDKKFGDGRIDDYVELNCYGLKSAQLGSALELEYEGPYDGDSWYLSICDSDCEVEIPGPYFKKLISILKTLENKI